MKPTRTIRNRLLSFFLLIMLITALTSVYSLFAGLRLGRRVEQLTQTEVLMRNIRSQLIKTKQSLDNYLMVQREDERRMVHTDIEDLQALVAGRHTPYQSQEQLMVKDISYLINKYSLQLEGVIEAKAVRDIIGYTEAYKAAELTASYINSFIDKVLIENLNRRTDAYRFLSESYQQVQLFNFFLVVTAIILTVLLILLFTDSLTRPVVRLAHLAEEISRGNFDVDDIQVNTKDEIGITARAFNEMKNSIQRYVAEMKEKAQIEKNLADQKVKNLEMQHLLKNAEMASLRSQMNPHFLFNSLNTGVQLAILEEADRTADFMGNLASLFRHNVRRLWRRNTIDDELKGLRYYSNLLKVRFGNTYRLEIRIPKELRRIEFPPLIFQPLVENSIIHGFERKEGGGRVRVEGGLAEGKVIFRVQDDGMGMSREAIAPALKPVSFSDEDFSSRTGVGMRNVVLRLRLFFNREDVVKIESREGEGTEIRIELPEDEVVYV
jgi:two-component system, sensor histidine kinase YesM